MVASGPFRASGAPPADVVRSRGSTAGFLAYASALVAGGGTLIAGIPLGWYHDPFMPGFGGGFLAICGVTVIVAKVVRGSGTAPCPGCGARLGDRGNGCN